MMARATSARAAGRRGPAVLRPGDRRRRLHLLSMAATKTVLLILAGPAGVEVLEANYDDDDA